ncbi:MAG: glycosyltransferase family 4 protein [Bacteroidia bacterium]
MTIIHIVLGKANPDRMNGVSKVAHYLATSQASMGLDIKVWGITGTPEDLPQDRSYAIRLFQAEKTAFKLHNTLKKAIASLEGTDTIIHLHGGFIPAFYSISLLLKKYGIRYVFSPHGSLSPFALKRGFKKRLYFHLLEKKMLQGAEAVHFLGAWQAEAFDEFMQLSRKVVIPNGQDMNALYANPVSPRQYKGGPIFSFCGRLINHYKGLDLLMDAFYRYRNLGGSGTLWLIGDGKDRAKLEKYVSTYKLEDRVVFWGSKFGAEKLDLLEASDVFVQPSRSEGLPTSVLEAAGLGLPCIVSKPTNMGEAMEEAGAGIKLEELKFEHIANALLDMEKLYWEGRLPRMGAKAIQMIKDTYSWEHVADTMVKKLYASNHAA